MTLNLETSRRSLLGGGMAALSVAALPIASASAAADRSQWEATFARYEAASGHYDACVSRLRRLYGKAHLAPYDEASELDDLCEKVGDCETDLMKLPAPDLAALRWKLDQTRDVDGSMVPWSASYIQQTYADIARLLPQAR